jgi:Cft2 family RNA processing exonuclease
MAEKKMTKRDYFNELLKVEDVKANPKLVKFIEHELDLLAKKNASGTGKLTATQIANNGIKDEILECMGNEPNRLFTISEMQKEFSCCAELSNQRVSALVRQLVADEKVERLEEKRKAVFRIAR